jgi:hypothetical protein
MAEEYDGIGYKGLGDTTMINVGTLMGAFLEDFWSISIQIKDTVV